MYSGREGSLTMNKWHDFILASQRITSVSFLKELSSSKLPDLYSSAAGI